MIKMSNQLDATIAKRFDITVKQNQTFSVKFLFLDSAGEGLELTGSDVVLSVRQDECGCSAGCEDGTFESVFKQDFIPAIDGADGNELTFNEIVKLNHGSYKYDLLVVYPSGVKQYLLQGTFKVKKSYSNIL